jgi:hypothetical protein
VCWLLDHDVDFTVRYKDGDTLLHKAEKNKADMVIRELVRCGLDVNATNSAGETILHMACAMKNSLINCRMLIESLEADVNAVTNVGHTILWYILTSSTGWSYCQCTIDLIMKHNIRITPDVLDDIPDKARNYMELVVRHHRYQRAIYYFIWYAKQLNIPKDMIRYIGKTVWQSRKDVMWFILD